VGSLQCDGLLLSWVEENSHSKSASSWGHVRPQRSDRDRLPATGDAAVDIVRVNGTDDANKFVLKQAAIGVLVNRKSLEVDVDNPELTDSLVVSGLGGVDKFVVDPT
jgi:hypothetical protein